MSKHKSNVNPAHYKTAGREAQGRDVLHALDRQAYSQSVANEKSGPRGIVTVPAAPFKTPKAPEPQGSAKTRKRTSTQKRTSAHHSGGIPMGELPRHKLSDKELQEALMNLPGWKAEKDKLHREYEFADFVQAWGFMGSVALVAESMSHHPEWCNIYNKVIFDLWTHTHNGISNLDIDLGRKIEELAQRAKPH